MSALRWDQGHLLKLIFIDVWSFEKLQRFIAVADVLSKALLSSNDFHTLPLKVSQKFKLSQKFMPLIDTTSRRNRMKSGLMRWRYLFVAVVNLYRTKWKSSKSFSFPNTFKILVCFKWSLFNLTLFCNYLCNFILPEKEFDSLSDGRWKMF